MKRDGWRGAFEPDNPEARYGQLESVTYAFLLALACLGFPVTED